MKTRGILNQRGMQRGSCLGKKIILGSKTLNPPPPPWKKNNTKFFLLLQKLTNDGGPIHGCHGQGAPSRSNNASWIKTLCFKAFLPPLLFSFIVVPLHSWKLHCWPLPSFYVFFSCLKDDRSYVYVFEVIIPTTHQILHSFFKEVTYLLTQKDCI